MAWGSATYLTLTVYQNLPDRISLVVLTLSLLINNSFSGLKGNKTLTMKKVYLSLLTVIFLGSCSNNDSETTEENKNQSQQFIGKWHRYKTVILNGKTDTPLSSYDHAKCEIEAIHEFTTNNKYLLTNYILNSSNQQCQQIGNVENYPYSYTTATNILDIDGERYYIKHVDSKELILQDYDFYDQNGDGTKDKRLNYYKK